MHATHAPPLQTSAVPQELPLARLSDSMHTGAPVLQAATPVRHGLPVTAQVAAATHGTHAPVASHTLVFAARGPHRHADCPVGARRRGARAIEGADVAWVGRGARLPGRTSKAFAFLAD